ncbi:CDC27 family protein [Nautilia sp.]
MTFLELEKECRKRRFKKRAVFFSLFFSAAAAVYFLTGLNLKTTENKPLLKKEVKKVNYSKISKPEKPVNKKHVQKKTDVKKDSPPKLKLFIDLNITENREKRAVKKENKKIKENKKTVKPENKKTEKSFSLTARTLPSYKTCISLSEKFYKKGDYKNALKWAKNANVQDNKKAESWILSAKSLYKLGKKAEALKILQIYYNYHKDEKVKKLMGEVENETVE